MPSSTTSVTSSPVDGVVDVPDDPRAGQHQLAAVGRIISPCLPTAHSMNVPAFWKSPVAGCRPSADSRAGSSCWRRAMAWCVIFAALDGARADLDRANPARLGEARLDDRLPPRVLRVGLLRPRRRLDDQVGLGLAEHAGEVPALLGRPLDRRRHVLRVALRRAGVDPLDDGLDLLVAQRPRSFLNSWMPTVLSMCHGGIWRVSTRLLIERAHGRASS